MALVIVLIAALLLLAFTVIRRRSPAVLRRAAESVDFAGRSVAEGLTRDGPVTDLCRSVAEG